MSVMNVRTNDFSEVMLVSESKNNLTIFTNKLIRSVLFFTESVTSQYYQILYLSVQFSLV